jgi:hypothetical protein
VRKENKSPTSHSSVVDLVRNVVREMNSDFFVNCVRHVKNVDVASFTLLNIPICDLIIYSSKSKHFLVLSMPFDEEFAKKRGIRVSNNYLNQVIHFACVHIFSFFAHCY